MLAATELSDAGLLAKVEELRLAATAELNEERRAALGQFLTPTPVATLTAELFAPPLTEVRLLEPGAGAGSLIAATLAQMLRHPNLPERIEITAFELDAALLPFLESTMALCDNYCRARGVDFTANIRAEDFLLAGADSLEPSLFQKPSDRFTHAILNPPYRKINLGSEWHLLLQRLGLASTNLYTAFLELAGMMLEEDGELAAIVPRSFCNGTYFQPFRERFLSAMSLREIHSFASRSQAFKGDAVLQENIIFRAVRSMRQPASVRVVLSEGPADDAPSVRVVPFEEVVIPGDPERFIHLVADEIGSAIASQIRGLPATLQTLGLTVSTGPVVDFRSQGQLLPQPGADAVPLLYPAHLVGGRTIWPREGKKPNAIAVTEESKPWLVPDETYVLIKRFSAKEERRRVVAAVHSPVGGFEALGIENHLNFIHRGYRGIDAGLAQGLSVYLNSTHVDEFFRQFSGHTQVNAGDLRKMPFPSREQLEELARKVGPTLPDQWQIDGIVSDVLFGNMANRTDPLAAMRKMEAAQKILKALGLPKAQQNERSALCLLALLNLLPRTSWKNAESPLCGTHGMIQFFKVNYGKTYAENSRETIRRQTLHQFRDAGLVIVNPDAPERPINSGKTVYQINPDLLILLRTYGSSPWREHLDEYLSKSDTLAERYAQEREVKRIPIELPSGQKFTLSPGGQNPLVAGILAKFLPQFLRKPKVLYVGDTDSKWTMFDQEAFEALGLMFNAHGKFPDLIALDQQRKWLVLFEAVTSHGPINPKRHGELKALFGKSNAPLVFVTTFPDRKTMVKYLPEIAWETEVWVLDSPTHLIHFNGERFLGPYASGPAGA